MKALLWIAASAGMLYLMVGLAWRGLAELGWLPARAAHVRRPIMRQSAPAGAPSAALPSWKESVFWALLALVVQYGMIWLGWRAMGGYGTFSDAFWSRFTAAGDAEHYLYLAQYGYASFGDKSNLIVFYPLYPLAIRTLALFTGSFAAAALMISQACWAAAAAVLRRLAGRLAHDAASARCAVLAMLFFPFSFFSVGVFTESLFLLLTLATLEAILTRNWRRAGILGFAAALCRTQGPLLILAACFAALAAGRCRGVRQKAEKIFACAGPAVGYLLYLWLNCLYCGSPRAFLHYQSIAPWYQSAQWVGSTAAQQWDMIHNYPGLARFIYIPQLILFFAALAFLIFGLHAGMPEAVLLYGGAYLGASYLSSWLISGSRYVFGCAALYLIVPYLKKPWMRYTLLAVELAACALYFPYYMQGQAIM